jgi:uncharacterized protein
VCLVIDLTEMADAVNSALAERTPCIVATADREGMPNMAFKGSVMVYDADHLAFWERSHGETARALEENPRACVLYRNPERGVNWRFYGVARLHRDDDVRADVMSRTVQAELDRDPERTGLAVLIRIDKVLAGRQVAQLRDE